MFHTNSAKPTEPIIDLMATIGIVLIIILLFSIGFLVIKTSQIESLENSVKELDALKADNESLQKQLKALQSGDKDKQIAQLAAEKTDLAEENKLLKGQVAISQKRSDFMNTAESILKERDTMYQEVVSNLNKDMGNKNFARYEDGRIILNFTTKYANNVTDLDDTGKRIAGNLGRSFADIIRKDKRIKYIEVIGHSDNLSENNKVQADSRTNDQTAAARAVNFVRGMLAGASRSEADRWLLGKYFKASSMSQYEPLGGGLGNKKQSQRQLDANKRIEIRIVFNDDDMQNLVNEYNKIK